MAQKVGRREKLAQKVGRREIYSPVPPLRIREETAAMLGGKGKDTSLTITKVDGEEEIIKTKIYKVAIPSLANTTPFAVHYEKIRIHLRELTTNSAKMHS